MGLVDVVRSGVATANKITRSLQGTVQHRAYLGQDGAGTLLYAATAVERRALIEWKLRNITTKEGQVVTSPVTVTFLEPVSVNVQDIITLPDGLSSPILSVGGFVDAATGHTFFTQVWLG